ncbi:MAG: hypothetical protein GY820_11110 [Gammaproteobacteria bacterium]|nr:hypothetical protein [Gammaproteobacteria bacterium]
MCGNSAHHTELKNSENLKLREKDKKFEIGREDMFCRARRVESNDMSPDSTGPLQLEFWGKNDFPELYMDNASRAFLA